ncbi:MAG: DUF3089 domain-containing protein [Saprospiraceae bacterium]
MKRYLALLILPLLATACRSTRPAGSFDRATAPPAPDYSRLDSWAAHPDKNDPADRTPCPDVRNEQAQAPVDVFFIHPTTYTGSQRFEKHWNADVNDRRVNKKTDEGTILYQASIFNGAGRVFAPRYRQAHLRVFFNIKDKRSAREALDLAYGDVEASFQYYLEHWNQGRPFIIAGHSQGALHGMNLLRNKIEGTPLEKQLVAAYLVGWPVRSDFFASLKPCAAPDQTDCYCSWRTWERNFGLHNFVQNPEQVVCTNPLNWSVGQAGRVPKSANRGAVLRNFCQVLPNVTDAEVHNGYLLCVKPKFPGSFLFRRKNYHIGDLNLYYFNVRENAQLRARAFLKK